MRVIAGIAKKRLLKVPSGWTGRPTADRVKESLFNILGSRVLDCVFLDLFAGTGNIGIEALSRGAKKAVFVEKDRRAAGSIGHNLKLTGFASRSKIIVRDVYPALAGLAGTGEPFDIVFLDPPYGLGFEVPVIKKVTELELLALNGLIVSESSKKEKLPPEIGGVTLLRQERYGDTVISFYQ
ncbi:MAG: 16S rRNA (guanine(966)-N(2))-methyltransferase RsmD [Bacillota bacterium]